MNKFLIFSFSLIFSIKGFSQNHLGFNMNFPISFPVLNSNNLNNKQLDYSGNTQLNMNLQLFYEIEKLKYVHQFGISNYLNTFNYLDSGIRKKINENYIAINYTFNNKIKLTDFEIYSGAGTLISILNKQNKYRLNNDLLVKTNKKADIIKFNFFIEERFIFPTSPNKKKLKQSLNFKFGFDFIGIKNNGASYIPVISVSSGYSLFYCF